MLDLSAPYKTIFMKRNAGTPVPHFPLPEGYHFTWYEKGDELEWAKIEAAVQEFKHSADALFYFQEECLHLFDEVRRRCIFLEDNEGNKVGTSTIWWDYTGLKRQVWIRWIAVRPEHQGLGLGKALSSFTVEEALKMEGDVDYYLRTQTLSHKAIPIYEKLGFYLTDETPLRGIENDQYKEGVALLEEIYREIGYAWNRRLPGHNPGQA